MICLHKLAGIALVSTIAIHTALLTCLAEEQRGKIQTEMVITAALNKAEVFVGDQVTLTETVPDTLETSVVAISHQCTIIGDWDMKAKKIRSLDATAFRTGFAPRTISEDLSTRMFSHPNEFDGPSPPYIREKGVKGITFKFKPQKPGMYLLSARWENRHSDVILTSNPIILIVRER